MIKNACAGALLGLMFHGAAIAANQDAPLVLTTSFDSIKGKFGQTSETTARSFTVGLTLVGENTRLSAFLPYITLEGPGTVINGAVTGGAGGQRRSVKGVGDMLITASRDVVGTIQSKGFHLAATGLIKLPTGDDKQGLGTGKTDYAAQADMAYRFQNGVSLTLNAGRQYYGQTPQLKLLDGNYTTAGIQVPLGSSLLMTVSAIQRDRILQTAQERRERNLAFIYGLSRTSAVQLGMTTGSTTASPDRAISLSLITQLD
ncbi:MAG: transporter [Limnobacter sp.]|uniref:transporter n=1 Tax=Limnobacter sp. TaxID=2003368 RepID=UPI00391AD3AB